MRWIAGLALLTACGSDPEPGVDAGLDAGAVDMAVDTGVPLPTHRVLFVVKNANAMAVADPDRRRKSLVEQAVASLTDERFELALMVYSDGNEVTEFTSDPEQDAAFAERLNDLDAIDNLGVLDGALRRAKEIVQDDLAAEADMTVRYSIVVLTDGYPTPTCTDGPDISPICESPRSQWLMFGLDPNIITNFYQFAGLTAYNRREDIIAQVQETAASSPRIAVHGLLLYTETIVGTPIEQSLGLNRTVSESFVQQIASEGRGSAIVDDNVVSIDWPAFLEP